MKLNQLIATAGIVLILSSCGTADDRLIIINSGSFPEAQITIDSPEMKLMLTDFNLPDPNNPNQEQNRWLDQISAMSLMAGNVRKLKSDSTWAALTANWENFRNQYSGTEGELPLPDESINDSLLNFESIRIARKWAELNIDLFKLSGEIRFGDELEKLLYKPKAFSFSEKLLKSIVYTHIDDQIFINLLSASSLTHFHTTGGTVKLIQKTDFPANPEMTLSCECSDVRYLDVFIRIPEWAVKPTVTYGNVKYVALPGEYCQISRKWKNGDEIEMRLTNY